MKSCVYHFFRTTAHSEKVQLEERDHTLSSLRVAHPLPQTLKMLGFLGIRRPVFSYASSMISTATATHNTLFVRTLMKSHKGAAKRWRKTANGFKRGQAARNHGNAGWSTKTLRGDGSKGMSTKEQTKRLTKLLPYH